MMLLLPSVYIMSLINNCNIILDCCKERDEMEIFAQE